VRMLTIAALLATLAPGLAGAQDDVWASRRLPWYVLPAHELVGDAPVTLVTPGMVGACGAVSDRIDVFAARGAVVLKFILKVDNGQVAISVRDPAAAAGGYSKTRILRPQDGEATVYVQVDPGSSPRAIALCNAGEVGTGGQVEVMRVEAARLLGLPADEAAKVNLGEL